MRPNRPRHSRLALLILCLLPGLAGAEEPAPAPDRIDFAAGEAVEVSWEGSWYPATVLRVDRRQRDEAGLPTPWFIRYDGYGESSDEWVGSARIRARIATPAWVDGPYLCPPPGSDWHAFVVTRAGKELFSVDSAGVVRQGSKKIAHFDNTWGHLYQDGKELGWIDTRGQVRVGGSQRARWDWGGAGLFFPGSDTPALVNQYGILYRDDRPWGTVMGVDESALGEDGAFALLMVCLVPDLAP